MKPMEPNKDSLSRKDIEDYLDASSGIEKNRIERKASQSNFDSDALEGWSTVGSGMTDMRNLDKKFNASYSWTAILTSATLLLAIGIVLFIVNSNNKTQPSISTGQNEYALNAEINDILLPTSIDTLTSVSEITKIKTTVIKNDFKKSEKRKTVNEDEKNITEEIEIKELPLLQIDLPKEVKVIETKQIGKEIYLADFKLVDYRSYRSRPEVATKVMVLTGLPANMEKEQEAESDPEWKEVSIPYIDYIEKTMRIFASGNDKKALARFITILNTYPDDLNALFYSGLCYYNLNQSQMAIEQFHAVNASRFSNFKEEAEWYLVLSYLQSKQIEKAKSLLDLIIANNGFYAAQAKVELKKI